MAQTRPMQLQPRWSLKSYKAWGPLGVGYRWNDFEHTALPSQHKFPPRISGTISSDSLERRS